MFADRSDFFHCPAYKLMISDLKSAVLENPERDLINDNGDEEELKWSLRITSIPTNTGGIEQVLQNGGLELHLKLIWIQGTVLGVCKNEDNDNYSLIISDDDGFNRAQIHEYNTVPGGDAPEIKTGSYVGALCQIWSNDPIIVLKATKVMYLGDLPIHKDIWKDEVRLTKAYLAGLILPNLL